MSKVYTCILCNRIGENNCNMIQNSISLCKLSLFYPFLLINLTSNYAYLHVQNSYLEYFPVLNVVCLLVDLN